jgi:hypothetical protein
MPLKKPMVVIASFAALVGIAACGSSPSKLTGATGRTVTIGALTDYTGAATSSGKSSVMGVQAGRVLAAGQGINLKYVLGDTATTRPGRSLLPRSLWTRTMSLR